MTKTKPPKKRGPKYIKNHYVCPECEKQDNLKIKTYGVGEKRGFFRFKYLCTHCNVTFEINSQL